MVAPSLEMVTPPLSSWMSLSMPRGPSVVRTVSATAVHALMLLTTCARPCDVSVPSLSRMICGCCGKETGTRRRTSGSVNRSLMGSGGANGLGVRVPLGATYHHRRHGWGLGGWAKLRVWSVRGNVGDLRGGKERVLLFRSRFSDGDPARGHESAPPLPAGARAHLSRAKAYRGCV